ILRPAAAHAVNKVRIMIPGRFSGRPRFHLIGYPSLVSVVSIDSQISVGSVENVADGICLRIFGPQRLLLAGRLLRRRGSESGRGHAASTVRAGAKLRLMIGDPVADLQLHHLPLAARTLEAKRSIQSIWRFLVVVEHEMSAHGGNRYREAHTQAPPRNIDFVNRLVADFTVPGVPDPMPVIVKPIARERLQRRRPGPQIVIHACRDSFLRGAPNRWPPLVANRTRHIDFANRPVAQVFSGVDHSGIRARLAAVLANSVVLLYRSHQLPPFKRVMRAGFLHIDIFPGLAAPDGHQRVPMIRRGNRDGIDILVLEQSANVHVRLRLWKAQLLDLPDTLARYALIHIANRDNLCSGNLLKAV